MAKKEDEQDEDDELDQDELEAIKEENRNEYDMQLIIAEVIGVIFKTSSPFCLPIVQDLFSGLLTECLTSTEKQKNKFALFVMDDMIEYLGPEILGQHYTTVAQQIIKFCNSQNPAMRQASSYGIGVMAKNAGQFFGAVVNDCLQGLRIAIEYEMPANIKEKKAKVKQFHHARDNAISALGKVIRYQSAVIDINQILPNWIGLLPIKNDVEESKIQNEIFATLLTEQPALVLGESNQRLEHVMVIIGTVLQKKYVDEQTGLKLATFVKNASVDATLGPLVKVVFDNKLAQDAKDRITQAVSAV